jgi:hypothetical protein
MYEAAARCKDIARAPVTNWEPHSVTRRILLRREIRDESSGRNSVPCQSLATLRRYGTRQCWKCVPNLKLCSVNITGAVTTRAMNRELCLSFRALSRVGAMQPVCQDRKSAAQLRALALT